MINRRFRVCTQINLIRNYELLSRTPNSLYVCPLKNIIVTAMTVSILSLLNATILLNAENLFWVVGSSLTSIWNLHWRREAFWKAQATMFVGMAQLVGFKQGQSMVGLIKGPCKVVHTLAVGLDEEAKWYRRYPDVGLWGVFSRVSRYFCYSHIHRILWKSFLATIFWGARSPEVQVIGIPETAN